MNKKKSGNGRHLAEADRHIIFQHCQAGHSARVISAMIGRSPSAVAKELRRNTLSGKEYSPVTAQQLAEDRRKRTGNYGKTLKYAEQVCTYALKDRLNPAEISKRLRLEGHADAPCAETIYQYLFATGTLLISGRTKRRPNSVTKKRLGKKSVRCPKPDRIPIEQRPAIVNSRQRQGDFEIDLVAMRQRSGYFMTMTDRASLLSNCRIIENKRVTSVNAALVSILRCMWPDWCRSLTVDNGTEFYGLEVVCDRFGIPVYGCRTYSPQDRGTNENQNRLYRSYLRRPALWQVTKNSVTATVKKLNSKPRVTLGGLTPAEAFILMDEIERIRESGEAEPEFCAGLHGREICRAVKSLAQVEALIVRGVRRLPPGCDLTRCLTRYTRTGRTGPD